MSRKGVKNRDAIKDAFLLILRECPKANASDLWHHVVYRRYCEVLGKYKPQDPKQCWVRASGDALELVLEEWYTPLLAPHNVQIRSLLGKPNKIAALKAMGISETVGSDKLDMPPTLAETGKSLEAFT